MKINFSISFLELLMILLIGLKLTGYIDWSWWLILSPVLIEVTFLLIVLAYTYSVSRRENDDSKITT